MAGLQTPRGAARWMWLGLAVLALAVLQGSGPIGGDNDDMRYMRALVDRSLVSWLTERYTIWSGRLGIDAVTLLVITHVWLWRILNAGMFVLLLWSAAALLRREHDARAPLLLLVGALLLSPRIWFETWWWMSGSFNYLWPAALGSFACLGFVRIEWPRRLFVLTVPAAMYACFQEQAAALLVAFQLILGARLWWRGQLRWQHAVQWLASLAALAVVVLAPGSLARFGVVVFFWFQEYALLTMPERIFSGLQLALGHAFVLPHAPGLAFALLLLRVAIVRQPHLPGRLLAGLPLLVLLLPIAGMYLLPDGVPGMAAGAELRRWLDVRGAYQGFWIGNAANATDTGLYWSFATGLVAATAATLSLWLNFRAEGRWPACLAALVWLASLASTLIVGLTPTLYQSGSRIFLLQDLLVLGLCAALAWRAGPVRAAASVRGERADGLVEGR